MATLRLLPALVALCVLSVPAHADIFEFGFAPLASWDLEDDSDNVLVSLDLASIIGFGAGTALEINAYAWDVTIDTIGASWLSEASVSFENTSGDSFFTLTPGAGDDFGGTKHYAGLEPTPVSTILSDGILVLQFFESFDDGADDVDAFWSGSITVNAIEAAVIPIPAALPLLLSGLGIFGLLGRRRRG